MGAFQRSILLFLLCSLITTGCMQAPRQPAGEASVSEDVYLVEKVIDGDTFIISGGEKVRLIGIDAPETAESYKQRNFHYGAEAKAHLEELIGGGSVKLEFDLEKRDQYERLLAYAWLGNGLFINAHMIEQGYARVVTWEPNVKYHDELNRLEAEAEKNKRGLWKE